MDAQVVFPTLLHLEDEFNSLRKWKKRAWFDSLESGVNIFIDAAMADASDIKNGDAKVMLGFIVRRCATDIRSCADTR